MELVGDMGLSHVGRLLLEVEMKRRSGGDDEAIVENLPQCLTLR